MKEVKAKDFLKRIRKIDMLIRNKNAEKEQWLVYATGTTMPLTEKVHSSSNGQKMENATIRYMEEIQKIDKRIYELLKEKEEKIRVIEQLNEIHYDVLHKIYVQNFTFQDVADSYDKRYSTITSIYGRALANLQKLIDAMKEGAE
jgi:DNA-directed RNA polymerase specialized sigma24 family protein